MAKEHQLYIVAVEPCERFPMGFLAGEGAFHPKGAALLYTRGEALKKARMFEGKIIPVKEA